MLIEIGVSWEITVLGLKPGSHRGRKVALKALIWLEYDTLLHTKHSIDVLFPNKSRKVMENNMLVNVYL
jgi:hypothetical protein